MADKVLERLVVEIKTDQKKLNREMTQLKGNLDKTASKIGNSFTQKLTSSMKRIGGVIAGAFATEQILRLGVEMVSLAAKAEGVKNAFRKLNDPMLLKNLQRATRNTVTDLQLMQVAIKAKNFKIPLEQLSTLLEFAQKRALQTGESVDYLVDSMINGIGRKSALVLDNLGISLTELQEEMKKVGDFATAATNIVNRELKSMGDVATTTAEKIAQATARMENLKVKGGDVLILLNNKATDWLSAWYNSVGILYKKLIGEPLDRMLEDDVPNKIKQITKKISTSINGTNLIGGTAVVGTNSGFLEGLKAYYEIVKFQDNQYYNFRRNMIQQELIDMEKAGLSKIQLKTYEINQMKQLEKEYSAYKRSQEFGFGDITGKGLQMQPHTSGSVKSLQGVDQWYVDLYESKGRPMLEEQKSLWIDIGQAQAVAMGGLIANWTSVIKLFGKANSMLQQFLNTLVQIGIQQAALSLVDFIGGGVSSLFGGFTDAIGLTKSAPQLNTSLGKINSSIQAMNQNSLNKSASPIIINTELDSLRFTQKKIVTSEKRLERGQKFGS